MDANTRQILLMIGGYFVGSLLGTVMFWLVVSWWVDHRPRAVVTATLYGIGMLGILIAALVLR